MKRSINGWFVLVLWVAGTAHAQAAMADEPDPAATAANAAAEAAEANARCPLLPAGSGMHWRYEQSIDFGVCYAVEDMGGRNAFGLYVGFHPSFHPDKAAKIGRGRVAGRRVTWYRPNPVEGSPGPFARETLVKTKSEAMAHVWVNAESQAQMDARLAVLAGLKFR